MRKITEIPGQILGPREGVREKARGHREREPQSWEEESQESSRGNISRVNEC